MPLALDIRDATLDDVQHICQVLAITCRATYEPIVPAPALAAELDPFALQGHWQKLVAESSPQGKQVWLARTEGQVAGFAAAGPTRDKDANPAHVGELYELYVLPDHIGQGVGHALWSHAVSVLGGRGFLEFSLWVLARNSRARLFYELRDARFDGTVRSAFSGTAPALRYRRQLAAR